MSLFEFIAKYSGQKVPNNGGAYPGECVSLAARYAQEVQAISNADSVLHCSNTGGARDLYEQFDGQLPNYYMRLQNTYEIKAGDLLIWGASKGRYGHVAIALEDNSLKVFEQLGTPVFTPAGVNLETGTPLGYLRKKGDNMPSLVDADHLDSLAHAYLNDSIANNPGLKEYIGKTFEEVIAVFNGAPERAAFLKHIEDLENNAGTVLAPGKYQVK